MECAIIGTRNIVMKSSSINMLALIVSMTISYNTIQIGAQAFYDGEGPPS